MKKSRKWNINKEFRILYKDYLKEIINFILVFPKVVFVKHLYGYLINDIIPMQIDEETGEVITKEFDSKVFNKNIENALYSNDILISKKVEYKSGEFYNQTKQRKGSKLWQRQFILIWMEQ